MSTRSRPRPEPESKRFKETFDIRGQAAALAEVFELKLPIRATGGGVRSAGLTQLIADVCGRPIAVGAQAEAGSLGAALLAGVGVGLYRTVDEAAALVSGAASVREPDLRWDAAQEVRYERWLTLASALGG